MDNDTYTPAIRQVVRRYSHKVAAERPDDTLSQALGEVALRETEEEQRQQQQQQQQQQVKLSWQSWLRIEQPGSNDSVISRLEKQKQQVANRWEKFHSSFNLGDTLTEGDGPPRIDALLQAVRGAETAWGKQQESGFGKTRSAVTSFLNTLNDHSYLFSIIPNEDKYTSLITGVITSVVKASVNHKKVAEKFSEALKDITEDLGTVHKSVGISNSSQMKLLVVDLYVAVFNFLCAAMDWYESRLNRFKASLNQNYATKIDQNVLDIKKVLDRIRLEADQVTQDRVQDTQQTIKSVDKGVKDVGHGIEGINEKLREVRELLAAGQRSREMDIESQLVEFRRELLKMMLGYDATQSLLATGQATEYNQRMATIRAFAIEERKIQTHEDMTGGDGDVVRGGKSEGLLDALSANTRDAIRERAAPYLNALLQDGRLEVLKSSTGTRSNASLPAEVTQKISRWIEDSSSRFLWVEGPVYVLAEKQLSLTAVQIYNLARNSVPCVLFTPPMSHQTVSDSGSVPTMSRQEKVLIALLYRIADQLIHLLPEELDPATEGLDAKSFESLNGSAASASAALDLIQVLLANSPPALIVIIDKLQLAESSTTTPHLERFIALLKDRAQSQMIKALFTTGGSCRVLANKLDMNTERVDARRMVQAKQGQPLRGWSSVGNFNIHNQTL
ncbi:hypothetical protein ACHAQJ_007358 [Trichoderma viride]